MILFAKSIRHLLAFGTTAALILSMSSAPAMAQTLTSEGSAAGAQCASSGINDDGVAVGTCSPASASDPSVAWVALTSGTQTRLPALSSGQSCSAGSITNTGVIVGSCTDANDASFAVMWSAEDPSAAPVKLQPLSLLGLLADVGTYPTSWDEAGNIIGESVNSSGALTAVLWPVGSGTPVQVSNNGDNCDATDANNSPINGRPSIVLNCPNASGTSTAKIAQATGLLNAYVVTVLSLPGGGNYCEVTGINDAVQMVGTCHNTGADHPTAAYWASASSAPALVPGTALPGDPRSHGTLINNSGHVVITYQDTNGNAQTAFWTASENAPAVSMVAPLTGGTVTAAVALGDNDNVALNSEDSDENVEAATWKSSSGTHALGFYSGGSESQIRTLSQDGTQAAGDGENSTQKDYALVWIP